MAQTGRLSQAEYVRLLREKEALEKVIRSCRHMPGATGPEIFETQTHLAGAQSALQDVEAQLRRGAPPTTLAQTGQLSHEEYVQLLREKEALEAVMESFQHWPYATHAETVEAQSALRDVEEQLRRGGPPRPPTWAL